MNVYLRGVRNAFRNKIRSVAVILILSLSIGLSLTMYVAHQAVEAKVSSVESSIGNRITVSPAGARGFEGGGEPITADTVSQVKSVSGVSIVTELLSDRLQTNTNTNLASAIEAGTLGRRANSTSGSSTSADSASGNTSNTTAPQGGPAGGPPLTINGVSSFEDLSKTQAGGTELKLTSGTFETDGTKNAAVIGASLATKNNLTVGSTFQAYDQTVTVTGIYDSGNQFGNNGVAMSLDGLRRLSNQAGQSTSLIVQADSIKNADAVADAISSKLSSSVDVTSPQDSSENAIGPLASIQSITTYSVIGAVVAGAVIILLTMLMIVRERRREIGVLKAIGASNRGVVVQFVTEAVVLTAISAVIGILLGVLFSGPVTSALASSANGSAMPGAGGPGGGGRMMMGFAGGARDTLRTLNASVGWDLLLYAFGVMTVIAFLGSALPAWLISKVRPAEVMRAE